MFVNQRRVAFCNQQFLISIFINSYTFFLKIKLFSDGKSKSGGVSEGAF